MLHWLMGFLVPSSFLIVGAVGKKLVSTDPYWTWSDWYLGIELALASVTACTINLCDLHKAGDRGELAIESGIRDTSVKEDVKRERMRVHGDSMKEARQEQGRNIVCLALAILAFFYVGTLHRQWDTRADDKPKRMALAGLANFCGACPMVVYMLWVKGVS
jgi:hypothetical protein